MDPCALDQSFSWVAGLLQRLSSRANDGPKVSEQFAVSTIQARWMMRLVMREKWWCHDGFVDEFKFGDSLGVEGSTVVWMMALDKL